MSKDFSTVNNQDSVNCQYNCHLDRIILSLLLLNTCGVSISSIRWPIPCRSVFLLSNSVTLDLLQRKEFHTHHAPFSYSTVCEGPPCSSKHGEIDL